jgi:hypothetical protein
MTALRRKWTSLLLCLLVLGSFVACDANAGFFDFVFKHDTWVKQRRLHQIQLNSQARMIKYTPIEHPQRYQFQR